MKPHILLLISIYLIGCSVSVTPKDKFVISTAEISKPSFQVNSIPIIDGRNVEKHFKKGNNKISIKGWFTNRSICAIGFYNDKGFNEVWSFDRESVGKKPAFKEFTVEVNYNQDQDYPWDKADHITSFGEKDKAEISLIIRKMYDDLLDRKGTYTQIFLKDSIIWTDLDKNELLRVKSLCDKMLAKTFELKKPHTNFNKNISYDIGSKMVVVHGEDDNLFYFGPESGLNQDYALITLRRIGFIKVNGKWKTVFKL